MIKRNIFIILILIIIVITISSCKQVEQKVLTIEEIKESIIEPKEEQSTNPYFLIQNATGDDIFKVEHTTNTYVLYKFCFNASCGVFDYYNGSCLIRNVSGTILEVCE